MARFQYTKKTVRNLQENASSLGYIWADNWVILGLGKKMMVRENKRSYSPIRCDLRSELKEGQEEIISEKNTDTIT